MSGLIHDLAETKDFVERILMRLQDDEVGI